MSLNSAQQASRLMKKSFGAAETLVTRDFFEEPKLGKTAILPSQIWAEADKIPSTAPVGMTNGQTVGVVQRYIKLSLTHISGSNNHSYYHESLKNTIPFNFGDGSYNYELYRSDGTTSIPFGSFDWLLDTEAGVLTFYNTGQTLVTSATPPQISFYKYVGAFGIPSGTTSGINPHTPVLAATNDTDILSNYDNGLSGYTSLPSSIDGIVTFNEGSRFLIKNQTDKIQNGVFQVSGTTLVRAIDSDGTPTGEVSVGDYVFVTSGDTNMSYGYVLSSTDASTPTEIIVGVNTQTWEIFSASKSYTADGLAIKLNGAEFGLELNESGTTYYGSGLYQSVDGLTITNAVANDLHSALTGISSIVSEISELISIDTSLESAISTEISNRLSGDTSLENVISGANSSLESALSTEISDRLSGDTSLESVISGVNSSLESALSTEISDRLSGDTSLENALSTEISLRISVDSSLESLISTEVSSRVSSDASIITVIQNLSGVTSQTAGSGLTYNSANTSLNVNVDDYTVKIVDNELRSSQLWMQSDKTTTITMGNSGATNISLTYDPVTPIQAYVNGVEYLVNPIPGSSATDMPFYFNEIPTIGSILQFDTNVAGFDLVSGYDLILIKYQYVDISI